MKARRDARSGVRRLEKVDLWEISVVTFPMLLGARVSSVKQRPFACAVPTERDFERWLSRDAGLTRTEARAISRDGYNGLKASSATRKPAGFSARVRGASMRMKGETERLKLSGSLAFSDLKLSTLRVPSYKTI